MKYSPTTKQVRWEPFDPGLSGFPPVEVHFEIPLDASAPNPFQIELLGLIRPEFPQLWQILIEDLRKTGLDAFVHPEATLTDWALFIPTWTHFEREPNEREGALTYVWLFEPQFRNAPELKESIGIDARFEGLKYLPPACILW